MAIERGAFGGIIMIAFAFLVVAPVSTGLGALLLSVYLWRGRNNAAWLWCFLVIVTIFLELFYLSGLDLGPLSYH
jgi:hypothetical protein